MRPLGQKQRKPGGMGFDSRKGVLNREELVAQTAHLGVDLQLLDALEDKGLIIGAQLYEMRWVEGQPLVVGTRQVPRKGQIGCDGLIVR